MIDSELGDFEYVNSFGFEWTQIDGLLAKSQCLMAIFSDFTSETIF